VRGESKTLLTSALNTRFMVSDGTTFRDKEMLRILSSQYRTYGMMIHCAHLGLTPEVEEGVVRVVDQAIEVGPHS